MACNAIVIDCSGSVAWGITGSFQMTCGQSRSPSDMPLRRVQPAQKDRPRVHGVLIVANLRSLHRFVIVNPPRRKSPYSVSKYVSGLSVSKANETDSLLPLKILTSTGTQASLQMTS